MERLDINISIFSADAFCYFNSVHVFQNGTYIVAAKIIVVSFVFLPDNYNEATFYSCNTLKM